MARAAKLEVIDLLRENDFQIWIVSGGGMEFMRVWTNDVYGISADHVIGSYTKMKLVEVEGKLGLIRDSQLEYGDDNSEKVIAIHRFIRDRPIIAFGNSDGDYQMLRWTTEGSGKRLGVIIHHTDGEREFTYHKETISGRLVEGLKDARRFGWKVVDMKAHWTTVFASITPPK